AHRLLDVRVGPAVRRPDHALRARGALDEPALRAVRVALLARTSVCDEEVLPRVVDPEPLVQLLPLRGVSGRRGRQLRAGRVALGGHVVGRGPLRLAHGVGEAGRTEPLCGGAEGADAAARLAVPRL